MTLHQIKAELASDQYNFLKTDAHLGKNIILLCVAGSCAYGTATENSDLDIRGCAINTKAEILKGECFGSVAKSEPDTIIYGVNKFLSLLTESNPNALELLGLNDEDYLYISPIGQELLDHKDLFLSKRAAQTFRGYAKAQLRRIQNKSVPHMSDADALEQERRQIESGILELHKEYVTISDTWKDLGIEHDEDAGILLSSHVDRMTIQDFCALTHEIQRRVNNAGRLRQKAQTAPSPESLSKLMMHVMRAYLTCIDLLKTGELHTCREKEHDFLMDVRNGKYLDQNNMPMPEFYQMADQMRMEMKKAEQESHLPKHPDFDAITKLRMHINEEVVTSA